MTTPALTDSGSTELAAARNSSAPLADLSMITIKPPNPTVMSYLAVKFWQSREQRIVASLGLKNFADETLNTSLGRSIERPADTATYLRAINHLTHVLEAKERYYGSGSLEVATTLVNLARAYFFRENNSMVLERHEPLREGLGYMKRAIDLIIMGHVDAKILDCYESPTAVESKIGENFKQLESEVDKKRQPAIIAAPLALEYAHAARLDYNQEHGIELQLDMVKLLDSLNLLMGDGRQSKTPVAATEMIKALFQLGALDDRFDLLMSGIERWAFSLGGLEGFSADIVHELREEAHKFMVELKEACHAAYVTLPQMRRAFTGREKQLSAEIFRCTMVDAQRCIAAGEYSNALAATIEAVANPHKTAEAQQFAAAYAKHFDNTALRFWQREWYQGAEALRQMQEQLTIYSFGEGSLEHARVLREMGVHYRGTCGYLSRFIHPRFGGGDAEGAIDIVEFNKAVDCYTRAAEMYRLNGEEYESKSAAASAQDLLEAVSPAGRPTEGPLAAAT